MREQNTELSGRSNNTSLSAQRPENDPSGLRIISEGSPNLPQFVDAGFINQFIPGISDERYHADRSAVSSTGVRLALESKRAFYRGVCLGKKKPPTKAMNFGKAAHLAILEPKLFMATYRTMPDFGDMRSSTNRAKRDTWQRDFPQGTEFLRAEEYADLQEMIRAIQDYRDPQTGDYTIVEMLRDSVFEHSGYFRDAETGLKCKIRPDILRVGAAMMPDLKTAREVDRWSFSKAMWEGGFHVQKAFYSMGVKAITGKEPRLTGFIAVQNQEPFDVAVYPLDEGALDRGMREARIGLNRIAEGVASGRWPGVQSNGPEGISLPSFTDFVEIPEA